MADTAVVHTSAPTAAEAAHDLATQLSRAMPGDPPDALIVFASPRYEHATLLRGLAEGTRARSLVGASSAGEFTNETRGADMACALALRSKDMKLKVGVGHGLSHDRRAAAGSMVSSFEGLTSDEFPYRAALVMTDALAGHADDLVDELTLATAGKYQFFGGGAGDNAQFRNTPVFCGTEAFSDSAVALEILSKKPLGIGVGHGWVPASAPMRVTDAAGVRLISLNGISAVQVFSQARRSDRANIRCRLAHSVFSAQYSRHRYWRWASLARAADRQRRRLRVVRFRDSRGCARPHHAHDGELGD